MADILFMQGFLFPTQVRFYSSPFLPEEESLPFPFRRVSVFLDFYRYLFFFLLAISPLRRIVEERFIANVPHHPPFLSLRGPVHSFSSVWSSPFFFSLSRVVVQGEPIPVLQFFSSRQPPLPRLFLLLRMVKRSTFTKEVPLLVYIPLQCRLFLPPCTPFDK